MTDLTDEDRAEIRRLAPGRDGWDRDERMFRAGLAAGRARAIEEMIEDGFISQAYANDVRKAYAIRALKETNKGKK